MLIKLSIQQLCQFLVLFLAICTATWILATISNHQVVVGAPALPIWNLTSCAGSHGVTAGASACKLMSIIENFYASIRFSSAQLIPDMFIFERYQMF
jgi:hypothetical protein